ncbi:hypothetical protein O3P69_014202 [Scylla paramamosain]|uniref:ATP-dependent DNA ligase family profile domain-containing protein n=1 Tax=Scylla paramamosain TaxID=85552 RepID=A0AAW0SAU6_SCYPA
MLMVCKKSGKPLPFGTLGKNKREDVADSANNCLYIFDVLLYNNENMLNKSLSDRRALLECVMIKQKNRVVLFELMKIENGKEELDGMLERVSEGGLEGLMVKDVKGQYKPGKRHWLKIKMDYLNEGAMVVLGDWYGKGRKGRLLSTFLMGCLDKRTDEWKTMTKLHAVLDNATLERLQGEMKAIMVKNGKEEERSFKLVKSLAMKPDYIVNDQKKVPVRELTGTEFTKDVTGGGGGNETTNYSANGISVKFPRTTREREETQIGKQSLAWKSWRGCKRLLRPSPSVVCGGSSETQGQFIGGGFREKIIIIVVVKCRQKLSPVSMSIHDFFFRSYPYNLIYW